MGEEKIPLYAAGAGLKMTKLSSGGHVRVASPLARYLPFPLDRQDAMLKQVSYFLALAALIAVPAAAQSPSPELGLAAAQRLAGAAADACRQAGRTVSVAVVDRGGPARDHACAAAALATAPGFDPVAP